MNDTTEDLPRLNPDFDPRNSPPSTRLYAYTGPLPEGAPSACRTCGGGLPAFEGTHSNAGVELFRAVVLYCPPCRELWAKGQWIETVTGEEAHDLAMAVARRERYRPNPFAVPRAWIDEPEDLPMPSGTAILCDGFERLESPPSGGSGAPSH